MEKIRFVGLDVHSQSIAIAVAEPDGTPPANLATIPADTAALLKVLKRMGPLKGLRVCYEAGPTGFGLQRDLSAAGIDCVVVAPSLVPVQHGDRVKTDRRDAVKLARFLRSGDLTPIYVPTPETEAMRDLERAREDAKNAERATRQQLSKFLLRHGRLYGGKSSWTRAHFEWIRAQKFEQRAQEEVLSDYLKAAEDAEGRVARLTKTIAELVEKWSLAPLVKALQTLRGVQLTSAVIIAAEIGNFARFGSPRELMKYLGLVPSEHSSGESKKRGRITRTGNKHVRRILVESAWSYRYRPTMSKLIRARNKGQPESVRRISWKAQERLHARYVHLGDKGKPKNKVIVALARELSGFIWAIANAQEVKGS